MATTKTERDVVAELQDSLLSDANLERMTAYTLGDAIREGCTVTRQEYGWGIGDMACALSAARLAARARGYLR